MHTNHPLPAPLRLPIQMALLAALLACAAAAAGVPVRSGSAVPQAARPLPLTDVRLTGGPLKRALDLDAEYLLKLEPDRMLFHLRERAGLPPKAPRGYGGWDGGGRQLTGHIAGHYLSAVSFMFAATGDPRFKERAAYIVRELKEERLERSEPERFLDIGYDLPADLVKGRKKVTIRFEATKGNEIASVFGLRMIRADLPR